MNEQENSSPPLVDSTPSQAELYEDLRRIGELEDQKAKVQNEIDELTERLTAAVPHLEESSLLHQMLSATLAPKSTAPKRTAKAKKATKKKTTRKR